jgi:hypothetical protein
MDDKRTMTLNLTNLEMRMLEDLAAKKQITKTALLRHALRLYQMIDERIARGGKLFIEEGKRKAKSELMVL